MNHKIEDMYLRDRIITILEMKYADHDPVGFKNHIELVEDVIDCVIHQIKGAKNGTGNKSKE